MLGVVSECERRKLKNLTDHQKWNTLSYYLLLRSSAPGRRRRRFGVHTTSMVVWHTLMHVCLPQTVDQESYIDMGLERHSMRYQPVSAYEIGSKLIDPRQVRQGTYGAEIEGILK